MAAAVALLTQVEIPAYLFAVLFGVNALGSAVLMQIPNGALLWPALLRRH
jgi:hypothetical protein